MIVSKNVKLSHNIHKAIRACIRTKKNVTLMVYKKTHDTIAQYAQTIMEYS